MNLLLISLIPTAIVLISAIITKRLHLSLIAGLLASAIIATGGSLIKAQALLSTRLLNQITDLDTLATYSFLFILGVVITIIEYTGGAAAAARILTKRLKSARGAQTTSFFLSCSLFIDDYLNVLTAGYIMRPITDRFHIARVKLAWLIHSLSSPIVIIAPLSTWLALIVTQLEQAGISATISPTTKIAEDPYLLFLQSIPFIFYSFLTMTSILFIVWAAISYGPMARFEKEAESQPIQPSATEHEGSGERSAIHLIAPIFTLIACFLIGIAYDGNYVLFGGTHSFIQALKSTQHISFILLGSSIVAFLVSVTLGLATKAMKLSDLLLLSWTGITITAPGVFTVFLASILGAMTRFDLQTGVHMAQALSTILEAWLLPVAIFAGASLTALVTGSAWGTIALLVPIAVQMTTNLVAGTEIISISTFPLLLPVLGAIFSGAVCGNHLSPFADLTILTATSTGCSFIDHIKTQIWYAIPAVIGATAGFLAIGILVGIYQMSLLMAAIYAYGIGIAITIALIWILSRVMKAA
jgi:Na+/H+ antiporter NhaC